MPTSTGPRTAHVRRVYERAAPGYDRYFRRAWLRVAGDAAEQALLDDVVAATAGLERPWVLDAGAGTGGLSRRLGVQQPQVQPVLVDLSPAMLARAAGTGGSRLVAALERLPFRDGSFDVVMCGWVLETVERPQRAVDELLRVLRPGGLLVCSFCSRPGRRAARWRTAPLQGVVRGLFAGRFLSEAQLPADLRGSGADVATVTRRRFAEGLVTVLSVRRRGDAVRPGPAAR